MTLTRREKSGIFARPWTRQRQNSLLLNPTGKRLLSKITQAEVVCWVGTGARSSTLNWNRATHGAICALRITTWGLETRVSGNQRRSSEDLGNARGLNAEWKWNFTSRKRKESMSISSILAIFATNLAISLEQDTSSLLSFHRLRKLSLTWRHSDV